MLEPSVLQDVYVIKTALPVNHAFPVAVEIHAKPPNADRMPSARPPTTTPYASVPAVTNATLLMGVSRLNAPATKTARLTGRARTAFVLILAHCQTLADVTPSAVFVITNLNVPAHLDTLATLLSGVLMTRMIALETLVEEMLCVLILLEPLSAGELIFLFEIILGLI